MILGMPARRLAPAAPTATWSTLAKYQSAPTTLSGANLVLMADTGATGTYANAVSSREAQHLGYYSGFVEAVTGDTVGFGFASVPRSPTSTVFPQQSTQYVGNAAASAGLWANSGSVYRAGTSTLTGTSGANIQVEIALRIVLDQGGPGIDQMRFWLRQSGGAWYGGGDPAADSSPTQVSQVVRSTNYFCVCATVTRSGATSSRRVTLHGDTASTTGTPPTGFTKALWGDELT